MKNTVILAACVAMALTGPALAQMSSSKMSKNDTATMKKCQSMSKSAMEKNKGCMAFMKAHPDMMNGETTGSDDSMKTNGGMKK